MNASGVHDELLSLLDGLCNEELTDEQLARLQELLRNDKAAQRLYFAYVDVHLGLRHISGVESPVSVSVRLPAPGTRVGMWRRHVRSAARPVLGTVLLAAVVAVGILLSFALFQPAPTRLSPNIAIKHFRGHVMISGTDGQQRSAAADLPTAANEVTNEPGPPPDFQLKLGESVFWPGEYIEREFAPTFLIDVDPATIGGRPSSSSHRSSTSSKRNREPAATWGGATK